jgi:hypothetical protein
MSSKNEAKSLNLCSYHHFVTMPFGPADMSDAKVIEAAFYSAATGDNWLSRRPFCPFWLRGPLLP